MKNLLVFSIVALFSFFVNAQEDGIKFGAKAGGNFANMNGLAEGVDSKFRTSFHVGGLAEIPITEKFAIQPEILYSEQGYKIESESVDLGFGLGSGSNTAYKFSYINVPVIMKYYIVKGLSVQAGPQLGILTSAKSVDQVSGLGVSIATGDEEIDLKDNSNTVDLAANFGLGYQLAMGLFFDARYNLGLLQVNDDSVAAAPQAKANNTVDKSKNGVIQVSLGYKF